MAEFTAANIEQQLAQLNLNEQSSTSSSQQHTNWRQIVTAELRIHLTDKLFQALIAGCDSHTVLTEQTKNHSVEYARKLESEAFEAANSRSDYYLLIIQRIDQIQKGQTTIEQSWRETVAIEFRKQIVKKLAQTIIPGCDVEAVDEQNSICNLLEYAQKVEQEIFEAATSRSEYYKLFAEKIYNVQQGVDEQQMEEEC